MIRKIHSPRYVFQRSSLSFPPPSVVFFFLSGHLWKSRSLTRLFFESNSSPFFVQTFSSTAASPKASSPVPPALFPFFFFSPILDPNRFFFFLSQIKQHTSQCPHFPIRFFPTPSEDCQLISFFFPCSLIVVRVRFPRPFTPICRSPRKSASYLFLPTRPPTV